jgi:hypothetical protein
MRYNDILYFLWLYDEFFGILPNIYNRHDITEILLKVTLNTITPNPTQYIKIAELDCCQLKNIYICTNYTR